MCFIIVCDSVIVDKSNNAIICLFISYIYIYIFFFFFMKCAFSVFAFYVVFYQRD